MRWGKENSGELKPGDIFEKYTVEKLLGRGGMGAVYLVRHNILDSLFALKVLFPEVASKNKRFVDRFIREAKLACKIKHPNLIAVHDAGKNSENGMYYLVMDYVAGGSVRDLLKKEGQIPIREAVSIVKQVAMALEAAGKYRMVHRDIKPDNIMFAADGSVKLADLGIAKSANEQDTMLTLEASVFGTPAYMSPEQAMDSRKVDARADIYSLGIVLFEMISGQRPFYGEGTIEILSQVVNEEPVPDIRTICPSVPEPVAALICAMTRKNLQLRIQSPSELLKRIHLLPLSDETVNNSHGVSHEQIEVTEPALANPPDSSRVNKQYATMPTEEVARRQSSPGILQKTLATKIAQPAAPVSAEATLPTETGVPLGNAGIKHADLSIEEKTSTENVALSTDAVRSAQEKQDVESSTSVDVETRSAEDVAQMTLPTAVLQKLSDKAQVTLPTEAVAIPETEHSLENIPSTEKNAGTPSEFPKSLEQNALNSFDIPLEAEKTKIFQKNLAPGSFAAALANNNTEPYKKFFGNKRKKFFLCLCGACMAIFWGSILSLFFFKKQAVKKENINPPQKIQKKFPMKDTSLSEEKKNSEKEKVRGTAYMEEPDIKPDKLVKNAVVILAGKTENSRQIKKSLSSIVQAPVALVEADSLYQRQLQKVVRSNPRFVLLIPSARWHELGKSRTTFETMLNEVANLLMDNQIHFAFVLDPESDDEQISWLNQAIREYCSRRSFEFVEPRFSDWKKLLKATVK